MYNVAIIPARGGSKGIINKNIKLLNARPLIYYTLNCTLEAAIDKSIDEVFVSTDDPLIKDESMSWGYVNIIDRPKELATDDATTDDTLIHAVKWIEERKNRKVDNIVLLQPTSPIRPPHIIRDMMAQFKLGNYDSMLSAGQFHGFLWKCIWELDGQSNAAPLSGKRVMRQEQDKIYKENGSVYIFKRDLLLGTKCRLGGKIGLFGMGGIYNVEIDSIDDFYMVEKYIQGDE